MLCRIGETSAIQKGEVLRPLKVPRGRGRAHIRGESRTGVGLSEFGENPAGLSSLHSRFPAGSPCQPRTQGGICWPSRKFENDFTVHGRKTYRVRPTG